ncbi:MAG: hypothetical protein V2B14_05390 [bacterium]
MNKKKIIIISGKQFSGKDTVASVINNALSDFKRVALADAIKIEFGQKKNLTFAEVDRNKPLYRADLINLGNKRRAEDPDYWIKKVLIEKGNLIVSDLRLKHELDTFKKLGSTTVRVNSDRNERAKRGLLVQENDTTEIDLDNIKDWDYIIENNESLESLIENTEKIAKLIEKLIYSSSK